MNIMIPPRVYIETSVFGFYFDSHSYNAVRRAAVVRLFDQIEAGLITAVTSPVTEQELRRAPPELRPKLIALLSAVNGIDADERQVERLARLYVSEGIVPIAYLDDARHLAYASVGGVEVVVTLNLKHLANEWSERRANSVNLHEGYTLLSIRTPEEVIRYED